MSEIKKGDVVVLKSGGPLMSVEEVGSYSGIENGANCVWFSKDGQPHEKIFDVATLKPKE